jgi:transcriptional regulator with XRE-family HTH domain
MTIRYEEIGNRLRAFRLGADLSAEEVSRRLGISRTALYRFEKGELVKIETLERLAELLKVSVPTLLGVGVEYISSAVTYFERLRQFEEVAQQIVILAGPISFILASDEFAKTLEEVLIESIPDYIPDREQALADVHRIIEILWKRKRAFQERQPTVINLVSAFEIERFLMTGFTGRSQISKEINKKRHELAIHEVDHFASLVEKEPMGLQVGIVRSTLPHMGFQIFRQGDHKTLTLV